MSYSRLSALRVFAATLGLVSALLAASGAAAQDASPADRAASESHFQSGVALYDEGRLPQALVEFREALRIAPSSVILYNVAQVEAELGHAVEAVAAYEQLLATARTIAPAMRAEIDTALAAQRARIATLRVESNAGGTLVSLDDVEVGTAPIEALRISSGEHVITARANGYESVRYRFTVAGGATHVATLTLTLSGAAIGTLRVDSRVPGVEVVVDGVSYGLTPLTSGIALPSGAHHVEGRRTAYSLFSQDVTVAPASESRTTLVVEPDAAAPDAELGTLRLAIPTASSSIRIDGAVADATSVASMSLPLGLHDVEVHAAERETYTTRIELLAQQTYDLRPPYVWTPEAREERVRAAHGQSDIGWGLIVGGAIAGLAGGLSAFGIWYDYTYNGAAALTALTNGGPCAMWPTTFTTECGTALASMGYMATSAEADRVLGPLRANLDRYYAELGVAGAIGGLGAIALGVGIYLVLSAPSEQAIDRAARATAFRLQLAAGPGSLTLHGRF